MFWLLLALCEATVLCAQTPAAQRAITDRTTYLADVAALCRVDWPKNRAVMIVCHGHSVPAGYFKTPEVRTLEAYPHLLRKGLAEKYPHAVINVVVTAIGGEDSENGARRFERDVLSLRPDVVTIDYGLNDRGMDLERAAIAWRAMIAQAKAAGVKVILLTPTPDLGKPWVDPADTLAQHAEQIRALAREDGVGLVDSYAAFKQHAEAGGATEALMSQRNHPNAKGHALVSEALLAWFP
ncbi:MAG: SGNH/GDSL hydrolase family protein [Undibacterium sp.]|nr:SGNH/GDSL hydrolase family protein [Opitutaceae bacterium]